MVTKIITRFNPMFCLQRSRLRIHFHRHAELFIMSIDVYYIHYCLWKFLTSTYYSIIYKIEKTQNCNFNQLTNALTILLYSLYNFVRLHMLSRMHVEYSITHFFLDGKLYITFHGANNRKCLHIQYNGKHMRSWWYNTFLCGLTGLNLKCNFSIFELLKSCAITVCAPTCIVKLAAYISFAVNTPSVT